MLLCQTSWQWPISRDMSYVTGSTDDIAYGLLNVGLSHKTFLGNGRCGYIQDLTTCKASEKTAACVPPIVNDTNQLNAGLEGLTRQEFPQFLCSSVVAVPDYSLQGRGWKFVNSSVGLWTLKVGYGSRTDHTLVPSELFGPRGHCDNPFILGQGLGHHVHGSPMQGFQLDILGTVLGLIILLSPVRHQGKFTWLFLVVHALPVCVHQTQKLNYTRICSAKSCFKSPVRAVVSKYLRTLEWYHKPRPWSQFLGIRVGEAAKPGPPILVGTLNVASLSKHLDLLESTYKAPTLWCYTETCHTQRSLEIATRKADRNLKTLVASAPGKPHNFAGRAASEKRGQSGGAVLITNLPSRLPFRALPPLVWHSTRVVQALVMFGPNFPVRILGVYGFINKDREDASRNNQLMEHVLQHIVNDKLPTLLLGDFNMSLERYSFWPCLKTKGWNDAENIHCSIAGILPRATYKSGSRIDFCLMCPVMSRLFISLEVNPDTISDHSSLLATFEVPNVRPQILKWKMPRDLMSITNIYPDFQVDWTLADWTPFFGCVDHSDPDTLLKIFTSVVEHVFRSSIQALPSTPAVSCQAFCGRSSPKRINAPAICSPLRPAIAGGFNPSLDSGPFAFKHKVRQIRRVQSLMWQMSSQNALTPQAIGAQTLTWNAIIDARGFPRGFSSFCLQLWGLHLPQKFELPNLPLVSWLFQQLATLESHWAYQVTKLRGHLYRTAMNVDWHSGGKKHFDSLKPPPRAQISMLQRLSQIRVQRHRHGKDGPFVCTIILGDVPFTGQQVSFLDQSLQVMKVVDQHIFLNKPLRAVSSQVVLNVHHIVSDLSELHSMAIHYWKTFWMNDAEADLDVARVVLQHTPKIPTFDAEISTQDLKTVCSSLKTSKARGVDGWSNYEIKQFDAQAIAALTTLFNRMATRCQWPQALTAGTVRMLSKTESSCTLSQTRPIIVLPTLYRVWSRAVSQKWVKNIIPYLPSGIQGNLPKASSRWLASYIQMCCEASHFTGEDSAFLSLDLTKAYNLLCRPLLELLNEHYGTPESLRSLYFQFLRSLKRFFSICNGLSEAVYSTCGVPEGCPFSVYQMMSLNLFVIQLISHQQHLSATVMFSYVDNWLFQAEILQNLHNTVEHVHAAARTCAFQIAPDKTWASINPCKDPTASQSRF